jgi:hypothetical protein
MGNEGSVPGVLFRQCSGEPGKIPEKLTDGVVVVITL